MKHLWIRYKEMILYIVFGLLTFLVDFGLFFLLQAAIDLQDSPLLLHSCSIFSTFMAIIFAYITNHTFVFQSKVKGFVSITKEVARFFSARLLTLVFSEVLLEITVIHMELTDWVMKLAVNTLVILLNYIFSKLWIFKKQNTEGV